MNTLKLLVMWLIIPFILTVSGCGDGGDDTKGDGNGNSGNYNGNTTTVNNNQGNSESRSSGQQTTTQTGSTLPPYVPPTQPVQREAYITLDNQSSVTIQFTVNGEPRSVSPEMSATWPYSGIATVSSVISGNYWSYTWRDGLNHGYIAKPNGIPGGFDLN